MANYDADSPNVPAFMRKKGIARGVKDKLLNTAYDYKQKGLLEKLARDVSRENPIKYAKRRPDGVVSMIPKKKRAARAKKVKTFDAPLLDFSNIGGRSDLKSFSLEDATDGYGEVSVKSRKSESLTGDFEDPNKLVRIVPIGMIEDYLGNIEVGIIELDAVLRHGEIIQIECDNGFFQQKVDSMQINRKPVKRAKKGDSIGIKMLSAPKNGGLVYKVI
ncbi:MAG: hypothetical protein WCT36_02155 [Candidatus Gracilibacteria bacterium]|jgi:hypothetical protein